MGYVHPKKQKRVLKTREDGVRQHYWVGKEAPACYSVDYKPPVEPGLAASAAFLNDTSRRIFIAKQKADRAREHARRLEIRRQIDLLHPQPPMEVYRQVGPLEENIIRKNGFAPGSEFTSNKRAVLEDIRARGGKIATIKYNPTKFRQISYNEDTGEQVYEITRTEHPLFLDKPLDRRWRS